MATRSFCEQSESQPLNICSCSSGGLISFKRREVEVSARTGLITHLQHVQQRRLARIVETEEQQLGVLVQQAERGEDIVD